MRLFAIMALAGCLAACQSSGYTTEPIGQFFAGTDSSAGIGPVTDGIARSITDPANTLVMIYNHGTDWGGLFQECQPSTMPDFLKRWTGHGLGGHKVVVLYLCTQEVEDRFVMGKARSQENEAVLDRLISAGVPPRDIFLFGHSGGASASLLTAERAPKKFNSAIVSGPGYGFAWLEAKGESYLWMDSEYDKWRSRLSGADDMSALAYVYEGDIYAPPSDARFLAAMPNVQLITISDADGDGKLCPDEPEPHFYWWSRCFRTEQLPHVEAYVLDRLEHREWLP